jgi:hypothetical protein
VHQRRDVRQEQDAKRLGSDNPPDLLASLTTLALGISLQAAWSNLAATQRTFGYQSDKALAQRRSSVSELL